MSWNQFKGWSWKYMIIPAFMGIFFGLGHLLAYFFFSYEGFKKMEERTNSFLQELV